jgi:hypothetical protein
MRLLVSLDGCEIFVGIDGFHFASNIQIFIRFGLDFSLVEILKVIQRPKFYWIWTKPHNTLRNMSRLKITATCTRKAMKKSKDIVCFMFHVFMVGIGRLDV